MESYLTTEDIHMENKHLKINVNEFSTIIKKMVQVEREILIILSKNLIYKSISETKIILKEHINKIEINLREMKKKDNNVEDMIKNNKIIINNKNNDYKNNKNKFLDESNIIIHFDTYNKNPLNSNNKYNNSNNDIEKDDASSLNMARFIDSSIEKNNLNIIVDNYKHKNKVNKNKIFSNYNDKEKKESKILYNYENLMFPPIKDDDSD